MNRRGFLAKCAAYAVASRIAWGEAVPGQTAAAGGVLPLAPDRTRDSYAIYSQLLRQTEKKACSPGCVRSRLWMIEDTTFVPEKPAAVSLDSYRALPPILKAMKMQNALAVPSGRELDAAELLADYTRQNSQIFQLERRFHLPHRYRLLDEAGQHRYFSLDARRRAGELASRSGSGEGIQTGDHRLRSKPCLFQPQHEPGIGLSPRLFRRLYGIVRKRL